MNKTALVLIGLTVIASGCTQTDIMNTGDNSNDNKIPSGKGLEITSFKLSDSEIGPTQQSIVTLKLKNYHTKSVDIKDISLYNTGFLNVDPKGCTPSKEGLKPAKKGFIPEMECQWVIESPSKSDIQGFNSKTIPIKLNLVYDSQLTNYQDGLKIHLKPLSEIETTSDISETYSNNEVQLKASTESPIPFSGRPIELSVKSVGNGEVKPPYTFKYTPDSFFKEGCVPKKDPVIGTDTSFSCTIYSPTQKSETRNFLFSVSYKYVKSPTLDIEVVNE